jgi:hypothetical protein
LGRCSCADGIEELSGMSVPITSTAFTSFAMSIDELVFYRGDSLDPRTLWEGSISSSRHTIHTGIVSTCTWCLYLPWWTWNVLIRIILNSKGTSAQSESPTPFLGFWVPTRTIHVISPWFRGIAEQPRDHSEAHC